MALKASMGPQGHEEAFLSLPCLQDWLVCGNEVTFAPNQVVRKGKNILGRESYLHNSQEATGSKGSH